MAKHLDDINFKKAAEYEKKFRHDVMAHIHTFGEAAPKAAGIIHLGATSCDIGDNADINHYARGLEIVAAKLAGVIDLLGAIRKKISRTADAGLYPLSGRTTYHRRQTRDAVGV